MANKKDHYGYWTDELDVDVANLRLAQYEYVKFIISHIPEGVKTILDVGCGTGELAETLLNKGYQVDCVSPCPYLKEQAGKLLGDRAQFFKCFYEDMETSNRYDMVMFCESFQYIDVEQALLKTNEFLKAGGPIALKFLKWKYRKKIEKAHKKYLEGGRTGEDFKKYKSYQLFVYKKDVQK